MSTILRERDIDRFDTVDLDVVREVIEMDLKTSDVQAGPPTRTESVSCPLVRAIGRILFPDDGVSGSAKRA